MALVVKNTPANAGDTSNVGLILEWGKIPWRRIWKPTPVFLPGKSHQQKSLAGYSPWGRKELDTTEQLSTQEIEEEPGHCVMLARVFLQKALTDMK